MKRLVQAVGTAVLMLAFWSAVGQTTVVTYHEDAGNPNSVNPNTSIYTTFGWKEILSDLKSTPTWSDVDTIPFTFQFNGMNEQYFKVSTNGILTFDINAPAPYAGDNEPLPSPNIPDKSILGFWEEFTTTGWGDVVLTNTFGAAPNRQYWVQYQSMAWGTNGEFAYGAFVFEETTNNIYVVSMFNNAFTSCDSTTVGIQFDANNAISMGDTISLKSNGSNSSTNDYYSFTIYPAGTCIPPVFPNYQNVTSSSVEVTFTGYNQGAIPIAEYGLPGFTPGTGTRVTGTGTSVQITGLNSDTEYEVYVQDSCGVGSSSVWSDPITFRTLCTYTLSGSYTVDPGQAASSTNYTSLKDMATDLNHCGVSGPVTITLASGTYQEPLKLGAIYGASSNNTITIDGVDSSLTRIEYGSYLDTPVVWLNGPDWLTLKNLTVKNTHQGSKAWGIILSGGSNHVTIDGVQVILDPSNSNNRAGILNTSSLQTINGGGEAHHLTLRNSRVSGGYLGAFFQGVPGQNNKDLTIDNVTFENQYFRSLVIDHVDSVKVLNNSFGGSQLSSGSFASVFIQNINDIEIGGNTINSPSNGMYLKYINNLRPATTFDRIYNNMVNATGSYGISAQQSKGMAFYHNTVRGDKAIQLDRLDSVDIRNNIFHGFSYAMYAQTGLDSVKDVVDYNLYYSDGLALANSKGNITDLASWKSLSPHHNVNSVSTAIAYVSQQDLHVTNNAGNDLGILIPGISSDIDGDTRPWSGSTMVDLGADERAINPCEPILSLGAFATSDTSAVLWWEGPTTATGWEVEYGPKGFSYGTSMGTTLTSTNDTVVINGLNPSTDYEFYVKANCGTTSNPTVGPVSFRTWPGFVTVPYSNNFDLLSPLADFRMIGNLDSWAGLDTIGSCNGSHGIRLRGNGYQHWTGYGSGSNATDSVDAWVTNELHHAYAILRVDASNVTSTFMRIGFNLKQEYSSSPVYSWFRILINDTVVTTNYHPTTANLDPCQRIDLDISQYIGRQIEIKFQTSNRSNNDVTVIDELDIYTLDCNIPTGLDVTGATANEATLYWTSGGATNFVVEWGPKGFQPGTGNRTYHSNDTLGITGLSPVTEYDFYVKDSCGVGNTSPFVGPVTWKSAYLPPYSNDFATYPGVDWEEAKGIYDPSGQPNYGSSNWTSKNYANIPIGSPAARVNIQGSYLNDWLVSPPVSLDNQEYALEFDVAATEFYQSMPPVWAWDDTVHVVVSTDGGKTWPRTNIVKTYHLNDHPDINGSHEVISLGDFKDEVIRVAFYAESRSYNADMDLFIDNFSIGFAPSCYPPQKLTIDQVTENSIQVSWSGTASNYEIEWGACGYTQGSGVGKIGVATTSTNSYTITGLSAAACHDIYLRAVCGSGDSSIHISLKGVTTQCSAFGLPFSENFDNNSWGRPSTFSSCWEFPSVGFAFEVDDNYTWTFQTGPDMDHTTGTGNFIYTEADQGLQGDEAMAITPNIDLGSATHPILSFWYHFYGSDIDRMYVDVYDGTQWVDSVSAIVGQDQTASSDPWKRMSVDLTDYSNQVIKIRFRGKRGLSNRGDMAIDDVEVYDSIYCPQPTSLVFSNTACDSVQIEWIPGGNANNTHIEYGPNGFVRGTGTLINGVSSPYVLNGLTPGMAYDVYVIDSCSTKESYVMDTLVTLSEPKPVIAISHGQVATTSSSARIFFDARGTTDGDTYSWDFGNGNTANGDTTTFSYTSNGTYSVTLTVTNGCGSADSTFSVNVNFIGVEEYVLRDLGVYPNPTNGEFTVEFPEGTRLIRVIDLQGRVLINKTIDGQSVQQRLDLTGMASGVYMIQILADQGQGTLRLILE